MIHRLIIVARHERELYDYIHRDQVGDESVAVITDRRRADRRVRNEKYRPERRRAERRRYDIEARLIAQGWAEVRLPPR